MGFSRMGIYQFKPGTTKDAVKRARDGLLPIFQREPGFISYEIVSNDQDRAISITTWDTREQAESSLKKAATWVKDNTANLVASSDVFIGEVSLFADALGTNTAVVEAVHAAFNDKDVNRVANLLDPAAKVLLVPFGTALPYKDDFLAWAKAFPDGKIEEARYFASGDVVFAEFIGRGTHKGPLDAPGGSIPATGRRVELRIVERYDFRGGKIAGVTMFYDNASFMRQLGFGEGKVPTPAKETPAKEIRH